METLSIPIIKLRDSFLKQFEELSHEKLNNKLKELLEKERDEIKRIVILASRVESIRKRIHEINPLIKTSISSKKSQSEAKNSDDKIIQEENKTNQIEDWIKVRINETTEVNGVRFPEGIQIDVTKQDSERLVNSGKASLIN